MQRACWKTLAASEKIAAERVSTSLIAAKLEGIARLPAGAAVDTAIASAAERGASHLLISEFRVLRSDHLEAGLASASPGAVTACWGKLVSIPYVFGV